MRPLYKNAIFSDFLHLHLEVLKLKSSKSNQCLFKKKKTSTHTPEQTFYEFLFSNYRVYIINSI